MLEVIPWDIVRSDSPVDCFRPSSDISMLLLKTDRWMCFFSLGCHCNVLQGLRIFNLDIIREHGARDHYYVIDINYFPGTFLTILNACFCCPKLNVCCLR